MSFCSYIICTSPRSGSTLLCKLLAATGVAGTPGSHFHDPSINEWLTFFGLSAIPGEPEQATLDRIFQAAIAKGSKDTRKTGIFGLRLQRHSFDYFMEKLAILHPERSSARARVEAAFGPTLFLHLTRPDKVAQSVSFLKAEQTGLWHKAPDGSELERLSPPADPVYDADRLLHYYTQFQDYDAAWQTWFRTEGIEPLRISYNDLSANPARITASVLAALGQDQARAQGVAPGVAKLADETNRTWADRFRKDHGLPNNAS